MKRETQHLSNDIHVYRYLPSRPKYALVVSHGVGGHGGIYDKFCAYHAEKGAEIWSYDAPGHGQSTIHRPRGQWTLEEWTEAGVFVAEHVRHETGLPVFLMGSSLGVGAAFSGLYSEAVTGAILMGSPVVPSNPLLEAMAEPWRNEAVGQICESLGRAARFDLGLFINFDEDYGYNGAYAQKQLDTNNTWSYDLSSWRSVFTFEPKIKANENKKPILMASGEKDALFPPEVIRPVAESIAGPVEYQCVPEATHQLMLFYTETFSDMVQTFIEKHI